MTITDAAHFLGIQPQSVYKKIYRQIVADGATPGPLFDGNGILTAQAEAIVRRLASCQNVPTEARGDFVSSEQSSEALVEKPLKLQKPATQEPSPSLAAYARLQAEHEVLRQELERVTAYLDDCDRLLLAMTRTVDALQDRVQDLEQQKRQSLRARFVEATRALVVRPARQVEVFYSNVLRRQTG